MLIFVVFLYELVFIDGNAAAGAQLTNPRQRIGREPPTVTIPGQGILVGKEVNIILK